MASTNPVEIVIELIDSVSDELNEIKAQLEAIDASSLDIAMDIEAEQEIATTEAQLDAMARDRTVDVDVDGVNVPGISGGDGGGMPIDPSRTAGTRSNVDLALRDPTRMISRDEQGIFGGAVEKIREMDTSLNRLRPRMMHIWDAAAAMIPVFVSFGAAAIGLAGAFGAVAGAGAAIIGLGLIGWGENATQSLRLAAEQARVLGQRLGEVFRPVGMRFAPILEDWMQGAPGQLQQLVGPFQQLVVFTDTLSAAGAGFVDWMAELTREAVALDDTIGQLVLRFGRLAGGAFIEIMRRMITFTSRNQDILIRLARALRTVMGAFLDISIVVTSTIATMSPLIEIIGHLANLLNNPLGRGLVTAIALMKIMSGLFGSIAATIVATYLPSLQAAIIATWEWYSALSAIRGLLVTTGIGLALAGAGMLLNQTAGGASGGRGGAGGGGGAGNTYINVQGDVGEREMDRLLDETSGVAQEEISFNQEMSL